MDIFKIIMDFLDFTNIFFKIVSSFIICELFLKIINIFESMNMLWFPEPFYEFQNILWTFFLNLQLLKFEISKNPELIVNGKKQIKIIKLGHMGRPMTRAG